MYKCSDEERYDSTQLLKMCPIQFASAPHEIVNLVKLAWSLPDTWHCFKNPYHEIPCPMERALYTLDTSGIPSGRNPGRLNMEMATVHDLLC